MIFIESCGSDEPRSREREEREAHIISTLCCMQATRRLVPFLAFVDAFDLPVRSH